MSISQREARRLLALADDLAPAIRAAFIDAINAKAATLNVSAVEAALRSAIQTGNSDELFRILQFNQQSLFPLTEAVRGTYIAGMQAAGAGLPIRIQANFGFGGNPRAVAAVQRITGDLITNVEHSQRDMTKALVAEVVNTGIPVRTMALDIVGRKNAEGVREGGYIGLDAPRATQAAKVAGMLRDKDAIADYFIGGKPRYTTTDRRFDPMVRRAISEGRALTAAEADKITRHHLARLLKNRALTISRTESLNALRAGQMDGYRALVDSGTIAESRIERSWLATADDRTRHDHRMMNGQKVRGLSEPFTFPDRSQALYPGDASLFAPAKNLILCRCVQTITLRKRT